MIFEDALYKIVREKKGIAVGCSCAIDPETKQGKRGGTGDMPLG